MHDKNKIRPFVYVAVTLAMSLAVLCAGHFLFEERRPLPDPDKEDNISGIEESPDNAETPFPVTFTSFNRVIDGKMQEIRFLEIDLGSGRAEVVPVLSFDKVFGFEKLSSIFSRTGAYAAVNGGFFHEYGEPGGMVVVSGEMITGSTGRYPVLVIEGKKAYLREMSTQFGIEYRDARTELDGANREGKPGEIIAYTPFFGSSNRAKVENITVTVRNGAVVKVAGYSGESPIPGDGMLISFFQPAAYDMMDFPIGENDKLKLYSEPELSPGTHAYECGSWIVRDGEVVIGNKDDWIGVTTNRDPRTAVGIKDETVLVLITVDGRQPGYSEGLTGKELGRLLLELGVKNAAMLDGGASTEMIVEGRIVNRPSFKGQERPLAGALIVKIRQ